MIFERDADAFLLGDFEFDDAYGGSFGFLGGGQVGALLVDADAQ